MISQILTRVLPQTCVDILKRLRDELVVTNALVRDTKIGLHVGKLRKAPNATVANLANAIVKKWKADMAADGKEKGDTGGLATPAPTPAKVGAAAAASTTKDAGTDAKQTTVVETRTVETDGIDVNVLDDKVRNNCFKLIYNALASDSDLDSDTLRKHALKIEHTCLSTVGKGYTGNEYKQKMRSLYLNLKGNNTSLRHDVADGTVTADRLCKMSPDDMASEEKKSADERARAKNIFNSLAAKSTLTVTDTFTCGKCKQKKVAYYQMQTRSADEPMTTFCNCTICGNRWKFC